MSVPVLDMIVPLPRLSLVSGCWVGPLSVNTPFGACAGRASASDQIFVDAYFNLKCLRVVDIGFLRGNI